MASQGIINLFCLVSVLFVTASTTILITSPAKNGFDNSTIPYSYANFGSIPYGKTLSFQLKALNISLCKNHTDFEHLIHPTYLIVDTAQSSCSFTTQALTAQNLGAKGIVFVSDVVNYYGKVVQVDDGNGRKIHISVLFVSTNSYRKLQQLKDVNIKVKFDTYKTPKANMVYFLSGSGRTNYVFLRQFKPYYQKIKKYIDFKPLYITFYCPFCSEQDCLIDTEYCNFEMDHYQQNVGELIIKEQIRQWNIWKTQGTEKYFQYMNLFDQYCTDNWLQSESCGQQIMNKNQIQNFKLKQSATDLMEEWRSQQISAGFISTPEITINGLLYGGTNDPEAVFNDICASLLEPPSQCTGKSSDSSGSKLGVIIAVIIIVSIVCMSLGFVLYQKCVKKELTKDMFSRVNELVARYATKVSEQNKKRKQRLTMRLNQEL